MTTTLCLDFGNTRFKAAIFKDGLLKEIIVLEKDSVEHLTVILKLFMPDYSILSSVVDHSDQVEELLSNNTRFHKLTHQSVLPFTLPVNKPETMGTDRLALAAAAVAIFPGGNNLAIGLGSCLTVNCVTNLNVLIGGSISPGMEMRFKAMHLFTARLPKTQAHWNVPLIGYDTKTNLQSGVVLGMAKEIDGIIEAYQNRYRNFNALLTGGDIAFFEPHLKKKIFADPDLIFKGLYAISQINNA
ncbi:MAG: type III pantothenate kinase [Flavisolibacter sp.]